MRNSSLNNHKLVEYFTENESQNFRNLMSKNSVPFKVKGREMQTRVVLTFPPTRLTRFELKNFNTSTLAIQFQDGNKLLHEIFYQFNSVQQLSDVKYQDLTIEGQCNKVTLIFERSRKFPKEEIGLVYFLLYESKITTYSNRNDYTNLSDAHLISDKKNNTPKTQKNEFISYSEYHQSVLKEKKDHDRSGTKTPTKIVKQKEKQEPIDWKTGEDSINTKILNLFQKNEKGEVNPEVFKSQLEKLFKDKEKKQESTNKKQKRESEFLQKDSSNKKQKKIIQQRQSKKPHAELPEPDFSRKSNKSNSKKLSSRQDLKINRKSQQKNNKLEVGKSQQVEDNSKTVIIISENGDENSADKATKFEDDFQQEIVFQPRPKPKPDQNSYPKIKQLSDQNRQYVKKLNDIAKEMQIDYQDRMRIREQHRISRFIEDSIFIYSQPFTTSGYQKEEKAKLIKLGKSLGLIYSNELVDNCIVVASGLANPKVKDIKKFKNCIAVSDKYFEDCSKYGIQMPFDDYDILKKDRKR